MTRPQRAAAWFQVVTAKTTPVTSGSCYQREAWGPGDDAALLFLTGSLCADTSCHTTTSRPPGPCHEVAGPGLLSRKVSNSDAIPPSPQACSDSPFLPEAAPAIHTFPDCPFHLSCLGHSEALPQGQRVLKPSLTLRPLPPAPAVGPASCISGLLFQGRVHLQLSPLPMNDRSQHQATSH